MSSRQEGQQETRRRFAGAVMKLRLAGLRPTRQRIGLAQLLFGAGDRHVTAEMLHGEALAEGMSVSLATVYNCLNQFTDAGILRQVAVDAARSYFDTNVTEHHHFFHEEDGSLTDIAGDSLAVSGLPGAPTGLEIKRVDIIIRVGGRDLKENI